MKILFDYQIFSLQSYGGISRYFTKLAENFIKLEQKINIYSPIYKNMYLDDQILKNRLKGFRIKKYPKYTTKFIQLLNLKLTNKYLANNKIDVLHLTYYNNTYNLDKKVKKILTVYDLVHEKFDYFYDKNLINPKIKSIDYADQIICISNNTKKDLLNYYKVDESKVSVIHLGVEKKKNIKEIQFDKPIILYVGYRGRYKNFTNFIKAYSTSLILTKNFKIVCFGGGEFTTQEKKYFKELNIDKNQILQVSGNDHQLNQYYKSAEFYIMPSIYEGFGLPILEAMSCGCPVLCGNKGSLTEVANDAAIYFNPNDVESMKDSMEKYVDTPELKEKFKIAGYKNIEKFTWESCAKSTIKIYKK